jgi:hypothetical protein
MLTLIAATTLIGFSPLLLAQDEAPAGSGERPPLTSEEREARREAAQQRWESMSEEERAQARVQRQANQDARREKARQRWESMTPEDQAAARERMQERRDARRKRFESMSPEEQAEARARMQQRRGGEGRRPGGREPSF